MSSAQIRREVSAWLQENWSPQRSLREWRDVLIDGGWAAPHWPEEYFGRGFTLEQAQTVADVFDEMGAVGAAQVGPRRLASETILAHGTDDQKERFLRPILSGEHSWCQLFSEPGSGSDLAGASTRAERRGDVWILNGQKVWNTSAHHADFGILLARSDWDQPKHQGLSYYLLDMRQPGVEVRPLQQMNGHQSFNEVFLTNAEVPARDLLGGEGNGWAVATTTLSFERRGFSRRPRPDVPEVERSGPIYAEFEKELETANEPYTWYPQREGRVDLVFQRARAQGALGEPAVRQEMARLFGLALGARLASEAAEAKRRAGTTQIIPEGSIGKLAASVIARQANHVHTMISGVDALLSGPESAENGVIAEVLVSTPAISIAGGTDEIQRNIIAERVLGMPKGHRYDRGPFRDIRRN